MFLQCTGTFEGYANVFLQGTGRYAMPMAHTPGSDYWTTDVDVDVIDAARVCIESCLSLYTARDLPERIVELVVD